MSGDGEHVEQEGDIIIEQPTLPTLIVPTGNGGGCLKDGPFKGWQVNMGPQQLSIPGGEVIGAPSGNPLDYNPRCLKRDLTDVINQRFANATSVINTLREDTIVRFQSRMQGNLDLVNGDIGIHGGPHYTLGGDPGRDVGVSPSDPMFFLHHAGVDRAWWMWQMRDPKNRILGNNALNGTGTFLNLPPSPEQTFDTEIELAHVTDEVVKIRDLMSTTAGPFCYIYE